MRRATFIGGTAHLQARVGAYHQALGSEQVSIVAEPDQVSGHEAFIDVQGSLEDKRWIPAWQRDGAFIVTDGPPAATFEASQQVMASGRVVLARPSYCDPRYELLRQQVSHGQVGRVVAARLIRLLAEDSWCPDGVTLNYAFDALDVLCSLLGGIKRIMAREQCLKRDKPDTLWATLVGESDAIGYLELCTCYPQGYESERFEVTGREGILEYNSDVHRTLRLHTPQYAGVRDAFHDPPLGRMVRAYLGLADDEDAVRSQAVATAEPLRLVFRALESSRSNQPT